MTNPNPKGMLMRGSLRIRAGLVALVLPLAACGGTAATTTQTPAAVQAFPTTVQNCGQPVTVARAPQRIVTVGHEGVELIQAAGGADRIVATFDNTQDPDAPGVQAASKAETVSAEEPTAEVLVGLRPDLVVSYGLSSEISPASLQQAGIASYIASGLCGQHGGGVGSGASFDGIYHDIETFGQLLGTQPQAQASIEQLKERVAAINEGAGGGRTAAHGYFYGSTFSTSGNQSMAQQQMEALGLRNVFSDVAKDFIEANTEELIKRDPQILILTFYVPDETFEQAKAKFLAVPGAKDMQAVRDNMIIPLPYVQTQPTVSAVTGLETITNGLQAISR